MSDLDAGLTVLAFLPVASVTDPEPLARVFGSAALDGHPDRGFNSLGRGKAHQSFGTGQTESELVKAGPFWPFSLTHRRPLRLIGSEVVVEAFPTTVRLAVLCVVEAIEEPSLVFETRFSNGQSIYRSPTRRLGLTGAGIPKLGSTTEELVLTANAPASTEIRAFVDGQPRASFTLRIRQPLS